MNTHLESKTLQPPLVRIFREETFPPIFRDGSRAITIDSQGMDLRVGKVLPDVGSDTLFPSVTLAKSRVSTAETSGRISALGHPEFRAAIEEMLFSDKDTLGLRTTVQTIGGCGALRLGADFLRRTLGPAKVLISAETWGDHRRIFEAAGLETVPYPYLNASRDGIDFPKLVDALRCAPEKSVLLLQICSHNPTGMDFKPYEWNFLANICQQKQIVPFLDIAYPGLAQNLWEDLRPVRNFCNRGIEFLAAASASKIFSLYDSRLGALSINFASQGLKVKAESLLTGLVRASYSSPPAEGAIAVAEVLKTPFLREMWLGELENVRTILDIRRKLLNEKLGDLKVLDKFPGATKQTGVFFNASLNKEQQKRLAEEFGIHVASGGRICLGSLPTSRVPELARALSSVV